MTQIIEDPSSATVTMYIGQNGNPETTREVWTMEEDGGIDRCIAGRRNKKDIRWFYFGEETLSRLPTTNQEWVLCEVGVLRVDTNNKRNTEDTLLSGLHSETRQVVWPLLHKSLFGRQKEF